MIFENIKFYAKQKGLSISEVERQAHIAKGHVYKWKNYFPNISTAMKVAEVLGVTVDDLLRES